MTEPLASDQGHVRIRGPDDFAAVFDVSRETIDRLVTYEALLRQWQKTVNLVAPSTLDEIWHRHFADSAQLLALAPHAQTWLDLGSGAGFPGLVVAVMLAERGAKGVPSPLVGEGQGGGETPTSNVGVPPTPHPSPHHAEGVSSTRRGEESPTRGEGTAPPRITLIESNARKCAFLREVVRQTGLAGRLSVDILSTRIETAATQTSLAGADVVTARALAPLDRLLGLAEPLFAVGTVGIFLKGRSVAAELEAAKSMWDFNVELVPSRTEPDAHVVVVRNLKAKVVTEGPTP